MLTQIKRACLLLLTLPAVALAEPIVVTTHASGTTMIDPALKVYPYALTITSTFDTSKKLNQFTTPTETGVLHRLLTLERIPYVIDYKIGTQTFHYEGMGSGELSLNVPSADGAPWEFRHTIDIDFGGGNSTSFTAWGSGPAAAFGEGGLLASRSIDEGAGLVGGFSKAVYGSWPGIDYTFSGDGPSSFSMSVSPVPEPASYALMIGGLLLVGARRMRGETAQGSV